MSRLAAACAAPAAAVFAAFWLLQVWIIMHGLEGIKKLEGWSAPLLLAGGAVLLLWAVNRGGGLGRCEASGGQNAADSSRAMDLSCASL